MAIDPVTAALDIGGKLIDRLWPDPTQRDLAKLELLKMQQQGELAQIAVNQAEAANPNVFVSGWRPAIGWVCGLAFAWNWVGLPMTNALVTIFNDVPITLAPADLSEMLPVLLGMLGLSGLRTVERLNGKA